MNTKEANLELIKPKFGTSFELKHFVDGNQNEKATFWHFHPELELVYVKGGRGVRHVGHHMSHYKNGDLVLIGSNLPHSGFTDRNTGHESEVVIQFKEDFLGSEFFKSPPFKSIENLFIQSLDGISFHGETKKEIGYRMEQLIQLSPYESTMALISILYDLAGSTDKRTLRGSGFTVQLTKQDNERAAMVFNHVRKHYKEETSLEEIAALTNMTVPSFCRYFKKLTSKTYTNFINEYRVLKACKLLEVAPMTIGKIAFEVGFNNIAHFNKHFLKTTNTTPSAYRKNFLEMVQV